MSEGEGIEMKTTEEIIEKMALGHDEIGGTWVRIEDLAKITGLTGAEIAEGVREMIKQDCFRAEPQPFGHRITEWDRANAPVIGGEARHLISWE